MAIEGKQIMQNQYPSIVFISTFESKGGAARAMERLAMALREEGLKVEIISAFGKTKSLSVGHKLQFYFNFILERLRVFHSVKDREYLYQYSNGRPGLPLHLHPKVRSADIVHLHWINFGLLSIKGISKLASEKPLVWTLHDMWAFTGGCHYAFDCEGYQQNCETCFYLNNERSRSSEKTLQSKKNEWEDKNMLITAPSKWLYDLARESPVLKGKQVQKVGYTVDTNRFTVIETSDLRSKWGISSNSTVILAGAMDLNDKRKGFTLLLESLEMMRDVTDNLELLVFGKTTELKLDGVKITDLGFINDEQDLVEIYNIASVFTLPSIQDNLPNMVLESMACGTPVVAFESGGVVDMIEHLETGYIAQKGDASDFAKGISLALNLVKSEQDKVRISTSIKAKYDKDLVVGQMVKLYRELLA